jgi:pimeloyl-ACP methyl ester carboxylesterase
MTRRFLLLHGSWHGAWCWYKVAPLLRRAGAAVAVPNLPGRGRDPALAHLITLGRLVRSVAAHLDPTHATTIVAHSRYGILATALAEAFPDAIARVIYLAAYMLPAGARAADCFASDRDSYLRPHVAVDRLGACDALAPAAWVEGLYADCSADDVALASSLLCPEPSLPALARTQATPARAGRVPRAYVRLTQDRAVSPALQDRLIEAGAPERVESLAASHSAYFSRPDELVAKILELSRS